MYDVHDMTIRTPQQHPILLAPSTLGM